MHRIVRVHQLWLTASALLTLGVRSGDAQTPYKIQPILKAGEPAGGTQIRSSSIFLSAVLNDAGQIAFLALDQPGGVPLIVFSEGKFLTLTPTGQEAPGGGTWPKAGGAADFQLFSMNQAGDIAFTSLVLCQSPIDG
jgi:hypothetical protein